jgi:glycosyltransferase involved in cell wall biosynthesis
MTDVVHVHPDTRLVIWHWSLAEEPRQADRPASNVTLTLPVSSTISPSPVTVRRRFVRAAIAARGASTVAVEALACGTPVVSSDNPGGLELNGVFGPDVAIVPGEQPIALAKTITHFLQNKRRTRAGTREAIEREFRPQAVAKEYWEVYRELVKATEEHR